MGGIIPAVKKTIQKRNRRKTKDKRCTNKGEEQVEARTEAKSYSEKHERWINRQEKRGRGDSSASDGFSGRTGRSLGGDDTMHHIL